MLKFARRSCNPAIVRIARLMDAPPVQIRVIGLNRAIAEDKFKLMLISSSTGAESHARTKLRYACETNAWIPESVVFVGQAVFAKLEPKIQEKMLELAQSAEERDWRPSQESDQDYENQLAANNLSVQQLDPLMRSSLERGGEALAWNWFKQARNEDWKVLLKYTTDRSMQ
ncbi:hypothetical protein E4K72_09620 [Oxalobacteraceae bacterium OM1]|nr:hypothetical protein E4K72_09620 [Oxalobacteraceae bacterium OM1]